MDSGATYMRAWRARNPEKALAQSVAATKRFKAANPDRARQLSRDSARRKRGFSVELVEKLRHFQWMRCAICREGLHLELDSPRSCREVADHDHATGRARGLLCHVCNVSLGYYEKHQRPREMRIQQYEAYLSAPPAEMV